MVKGAQRDGKKQVVRLVGRLTRQSARLHPSMPSGGGLLKTAPVSEVRLDLVRVTSGLVFPLPFENKDEILNLLHGNLFSNMLHELSKRGGKRICKF